MAGKAEAGGRRASCWLMCPSVADRGLCFGPCRLSGWHAALFRGHEWAKKEKKKKKRGGRQSEKDHKQTRSTTNGGDGESAELFVKENTIIIQPLFSSFPPPNKHVRCSAGRKTNTAALFL